MSCALSASKCSRWKSKWNTSSVIFYPWGLTNLIKILTRRGLTQTGGNSVSLMVFAVAFLTCLIFLCPHILRPPRAWTRCPVPFLLGPFDFYCFYFRSQSWFYFFLGAVRRLNNSDSDHVSLALGLQRGGKVPGTFNGKLRLGIEKKYSKLETYGNSGELTGN